MRGEPTLTRPRAIAWSQVAWGDLRLVIIGAAGLAALTLLGEHAPFLAPLRLILGVIYVLFAPGYCLTAALFPRAGDLDGIERVGISLGLSVAQVSLLAPLLDRLPWGLRPIPIMVAELHLIAVASIIALLRRAALGPGEAFTPAPSIRWRSLPAHERRIYALAAGVLAITVAAVAWTLLAPASDSFMTEFYVLGEQGRAEGFPRQAAVGEELAIVSGIVNRERTVRSYRIELWANDPWQPGRRQQVGAVGPLSLQPGEAWRGPMRWVMPWAGRDQQVEILLYVDQEPMPYRRLLLWLDVTEGSAGSSLKR